ncbi:response regulator transcription factor, partial [Chromobacterium haemolyticum]|nr:response regulator transcription factor [Chromobacterium haemolyticum]
MNTLLLIEDDATLGDGLSRFLEDAGYRCLWLG